tara:strand:+ start:5305 stop:5625 length:321 start_codon:yes stop_codon:yes gene_type:complete
VFQDGEFLVEVAREEGQEGDDGQDDVGDERVGAGGECCGEAGDELARENQTAEYGHMMMPVCSHQSYSYFEHIVAQREVAEAVPGARCALSHAAFGILEVFLCVLV